MALVAYDYGSESEEEEDEIQIKQNCENGLVKVDGDGSAVEEQNKKSYGDSKDTNSPTLSSEISVEENPTAVSVSYVSSMFQKLPVIIKVSPDNIKDNYEDVVEDYIPKAKVPKKEKTKVKITIPSLSAFEDIEEQEPASKKFKKSSKSTSLLSLLPPIKCVPISNKSFVPNVLTQKNKTKNVQNNKPSKPLIPNSVRKKKENEGKTKENESDDSDIEMPETYDDELWQKVCGKKVVKDIIIEEPPVIDEPKVELAPDIVAPYQGLDNAAFKELVGKKSRMPRNIKLIDVNEEELVAEKDLWMTKSLTDPEYVPKPAEDDPSDPTKKKKHHITYLAHKAKANEQELQSQWATSKHNRMQSRAKYGF